MSDSNAVDRLVAIEDVKQLRARYCRAIDTKNWALLESLLTPDVRLDLPSLRSKGVEVVGVEAFLALVRDWFGEAPSLHSNYLPEIEIVSPSRATAVWAQEHFIGALYRAGEHHGHGYGYSYDEYVKSEGRWLVASVRLEPLFQIV
jgi:hypothetical protein